MTGGRRQAEGRARRDAAQRAGRPVQPRHAYNPTSGTLDNRVDLPGAEGVSQLLCGLVGHGTAAADGQPLCDLFNALNDRLSALGDTGTGDLPLGLLGRASLPGAVGRHDRPAPPTPRLAVAALALPLAALTGCQGAYDLPLPGGAAMGGNGYQVTAQFADVMDLVPQSAVKVDDVTVGKVERITVDGWTARVTVRVKDSVTLPANATAELRQTSLLGEKYVELAPPTDVAPQGRLTDGAVIPIVPQLAHARGRGGARRAVAAAQRRRGRRSSRSSRPSSTRRPTATRRRSATWSAS